MTREQIMQEIIQKQGELIQELLSQCLNVRSTKNELILRVDIASLKSRLAEAEEEKKLTNDEILKEAEIRFPYDKGGIPDSHEYSFVEGAEWARDWQSR